VIRIPVSLPLWSAELSGFRLIESVLLARHEDKGKVAEHTIIKAREKIKFKCRIYLLDV